MILGCQELPGAGRVPRVKFGVQGGILGCQDLPGGLEGILREGFWGVRNPERVPVGILGSEELGEVGGSQQGFLGGFQG